MISKIEIKKSFLLISSSPFGGKLPTVNIFFNWIILEVNLILNENTTNNYTHLPIIDKLIEHNDNFPKTLQQALFFYN